MKTRVVILLAVVCAACSARALASSVTYCKQVVYAVPVHVIIVDLNDRSVKVTVALSKNGRGSSERAASVVSRCRPVAAVTGTFFDTKSLLPTGDIVIKGVRAHSGHVGSALCITSENRARIIPPKERARLSNEDFETVLAGGLTLVYGGRVSINPGSEGFSDRRLFKSTRRTAVGVTAANKLVLIAVNRPTGLQRLAKIMQRLGATQAMLLDGGSSTTMYVNGRFVSVPGRRLTNLLLVQKTKLAGPPKPAEAPAVALREKEIRASAK